MGYVYINKPHTRERNTDIPATVSSAFARRALFDEYRAPKAEMRRGDDDVDTDDHRKIESQLPAATGRPTAYSHTHDLI